MVEKKIKYYLVYDEETKRIKGWFLEPTPENIPVPYINVTKDVHDKFRLNDPTPNFVDVENKDIYYKSLRTDKQKLNTQSVQLDIITDGLHLSIEKLLLVKERTVRKANRLSEKLNHAKTVLGYNDIVLLEYERIYEIPVIEQIEYSTNLLQNGATIRNMSVEDYARLIMNSEHQQRLQLSQLTSTLEAYQALGLQLLLKGDIDKVEDYLRLGVGLNDTLSKNYGGTFEDAILDVESILLANVVIMVEEEPEEEEDDKDEGRMGRRR